MRKAQNALLLYCRRKERHTNIHIMFRASVQQKHNCILPFGVRPFWLNSFRLTELMIPFQVSRPWTKSLIPSKLHNLPNLNRFREKRYSVETTQYTSSTRQKFTHRSPLQKRETNMTSQNAAGMNEMKNLCVFSLILFVIFSCGQCSVYQLFIFI